MTNLWILNYDTLCNNDNLIEFIIKAYPRHCIDAFVDAYWRQTDIT